MSRFSGKPYGWIGGGALAACLLFVLTWVLGISPQVASQRDLAEQLDVQTNRKATLQQQLDRMRADAGNLPQYQQKLDRDRKALPASAAMSDFLRELHTLGQGSGVSVTLVAVGNAVPPAAGGSQACALPIQLGAKGTASKLTSFLERLQHEGGRAVLVLDAKLIWDGKGGAHSAADLDVNLQVFVTGTDCHAKPTS